MCPREVSANEQTSSLPVELDFTPGKPRTTHPLPAVWQESISTISPFQLVDELAQAYETSLRLQDVLRPLVPRMTWYQAADAAWQCQGNWPVEELAATIMFTDITGFTALIDTHPVREVLDSLDDYFILLSRVIQQHRGDVHKFLGDGLMALFICPSDAVQAGCEIQRAVAGFNARQTARGLWIFKMRLAIDTGAVILANVGPPERQDHTLIGRPVNRASHLSEIARPGTVCVSQSTYDKLAHKHGFTPRTMSMTRSEEKPVTVYEIACL